MLTFCRNRSCGWETVPRVSSRLALSMCLAAGLSVRIVRSLVIAAELRKDLFVLPPTLRSLS